MKLAKNDENACANNALIAAPVIPNFGIIIKLDTTQTTAPITVR